MIDTEAVTAAESDRKKREHVRLVPTRPEEFRLTVRAEGFDVDAQLLDYSPFGIGARVPATERNRALFAKDRVFALLCTFGASRFPSKGKIAAIGEARDGNESWLRIGFSLLSESTPTREQLAQRRGELRLETDEHLAPLAVCEDELWFGERIFLRVRDVSAGGLALELPSDKVPFLPKQRLWLRLLIPFFGDFKACVRVAYVKPLASGPDGVGGSHLVGVNLLRSVSDVAHVLCDYIAFTHPEFEREELRQAGFDVTHLPRSLDALRPRIVTAQQGEAWHDETLGFVLEDGRGLASARGSVRFLAGGSRLEAVSFESDVEGAETAFIGFLLLLADLHASEDIVFTAHVRAALSPAWRSVPESIASRAALLDALPVSFLTGLAPLFKSRLSPPRGSRAALALRALAFVVRS